GIAKFVEDSTSLETLRDALTPVYAAPEQWRGERPSTATDVYALGCIIHRALNGRVPFVGDLDDIREGHLHREPPALSDAPARLSSLVTHMLRKEPASRPSLSRVQSVLSAIEKEPPRPSRAALADAGRVVARHEAEEEAKRQAAETARKQRQRMADEAIRDLRRSVAVIFDEIDKSSESTRRELNAITLGA